MKMMDNDLVENIRIQGDLVVLFVVEGQFVLRHHQRIYF
jgi:hypothetical protein